ncbi:hypothetical protein EUGRSUZ_H01676 [Eucalyptus grandis]|uniref:Uncharacterized protein n=2 Tax=Eucalyptus grandis TaxID=71139 RepID=A0ACC3JQ95_EUCGR|nr:hypothetical protein EUGRSUZ_H01676 [Eucalyptus grandis]
MQFYKPKRPASAFSVFMEEFKKQYKKKHPNNKSVAAVGKAGAGEWKVEYEKSMKAYIERQAEGTKTDEEESKNSMSKVNSEDEGEESSVEEDDE